jgi:hypothetical protein
VTAGGTGVGGHSHGGALGRGLRMRAVASAAWRPKAVGVAVILAE